MSANMIINFDFFYDFIHIFDDDPTDLRMYPISSVLTYIFNAPVMSHSKQEHQYYQHQNSEPYAANRRPKIVCIFLIFFIFVTYLLMLHTLET